MRDLAGRRGQHSGATLAFVLGRVFKPCQAGAWLLWVSAWTTSAEGREMNTNATMTHNTACMS